jgi:hypothetical protein
MEHGGERATGGRGAQMAKGAADDQLDVPLEDTELLAEVELTTNLIIAATEVDSLDQREVDRLLGVDVTDTAAPATSSPSESPIPEQKARLTG